MIPRTPRRRSRRRSASLIAASVAMPVLAGGPLLYNFAKETYDNGKHWTHVAGLAYDKKYSKYFRNQAEKEIQLIDKALEELNVIENREKDLKKKVETEYKKIIDMVDEAVNEATEGEIKPGRKRTNTDTYCRFRTKNLCRSPCEWDEGKEKNKCHLPTRLAKLTKQDKEEIRDFVIDTAILGNPTTTGPTRNKKNVHRDENFEIAQREKLKLKRRREKQFLRREEYFEIAQRARDKLKLKRRRKKQLDAAEETGHPRTREGFLAHKSDVVEEWIKNSLKQNPLKLM